jgi:hypothetical protein
MVMWVLCSHTKKPSRFLPFVNFSVLFLQVVLSACSSYFQKLLLENPCKHPTIIMPQDVCYADLKFIIEFVYKGEIDVSQTELQVLTDMTKTTTSLFLRRRDWRSALRSRKEIGHCLFFLCVIIERKPTCPFYTMRIAVFVWFCAIVLAAFC